MPLAMMKPGSSARVAAIRAGRGLCNRLASMGLIPGVEVEVVSNTYRGPVVVAVRDTRLVLGRGMAQAIEMK